MFFAAVLATTLAAQSPYGVCAHLPRDEFDTREAALARMAEVDIRTVRADIDWWRKSSPDAPWDFSRFDAVVGSLANPTNYLAVLKTAYETVKEIDPDMKVAFGGVSEFGLGYLGEIYRLGGGKYFDVFCCHPYTLPFAPEGRLAIGLEKLRA